ncbi:MAG: hypothetical protein KDC67_03375 [Ignavibacteriae bacterium]|nr:hypothetical protein [Ignavibacteriota bacterium]
MKRTPHIGVVYPNYFPENFGEFITSDIRHERLDLDLIRQEPEVWASLEWAIPGLIATYLFKPYFESFLKEAGKDHYQKLRNVLGELLKKSAEIPVHTVVSKKSTFKIDKSNSQSKAISIHIELKNGALLKLMFDNQMNSEIWVSFLDKMLDMLDEHYDKFPNDNLTKRLNHLDFKNGKEVYSVINKNIEDWEFLDWNAILAMERGNS